MAATSKSNVNGSSSEALITRLVRAAAPLLWGFPGLSDSEVADVLQLGKATHAWVDWTTGFDTGAWHFALQQHGRVSCSLQEMQERADLAVCWEMPAEWTEANLSQLRARGSRVVVIGAASSGQRTVSHDVTMIEWRRQEQAIALRRLRERQTPSWNPAGGDLAEPDGLDSLETALDAARYPVFVAGRDFACLHGNTGTAALTALVREHNRDRNARLLIIPESPDEPRRADTFSAHAGAPFGVVFRDGSPLFRGAEGTAERLLATRRTDLVVFFGDARVGRWPDLVTGCPVPLVVVGPEPLAGADHIPASVADGHSDTIPSIASLLSQWIAETT